jgi:hypothetical protein
VLYSHRAVAGGAASVAIIGSGRVPAQEIDRAIACPLVRSETDSPPRLPDLRSRVLTGDVKLANRKLQDLLYCSSATEI